MSARPELELTWTRFRPKGVASRQGELAFAKASAFTEFTADKTVGRHAFENEAVYAQFRESLKEPSILSRKEIRREFFRARKRPVIRRDTAPSWR